MINGKVRFIRVNGRVVPIKDKDPSKAKMAKNYNKRGDGANQASHIEAKYASKGFNNSKSAKALTGAGLATMAGALFTKGRASGALFGASLGLFVAGSAAAKKNQKKYDKQKQREYVRTFGTDSQGNRPSKTRSGV